MGLRVSLILATAILAVSVLYLGSGPVGAKNNSAAPALESSAVKRGGPDSAAEKVERTRAYWTPRRMATATPVPMGVRPARKITPSAPPQTGLEWTGPSRNPPARTTGTLFFTVISDPNTPTDGHRGYCSASTVDSPNKDLVYTAGHCLLDRRIYGPNAVLVEDITFVPGYHCSPLEPPPGELCAAYTEGGEKPYGEWVAKSIHVHPEWQNSGNEQYDIAAVQVFPSRGTEGKRLVDVVGGNEIGFNLPAERETYVFGYPSNYKNGQVLHYCNGVTGVRNSWQMYIPCTMWTGSSGGPWLTAFGGERGVLYSVTSAGVEGTELQGPSFDDSVRDFHNRIVGTDSVNPGTIAYQGWDGHDTEIYSMDSDGREKHSLTSNDQHDIYPTVSPNGARIAYSRSEGNDYEIFTMDSDGRGTPVQLTFNNTNDSRPSYSGNGTRIAYEGYDGNDWEIYTINANGGTPFKVTNNNREDRDPDYSPDGTRIAYRACDGEGDACEREVDPADYEIYTINAALVAGTPDPVTNNDTGDFGPDYAPGGERIAYQGCGEFRMEGEGDACERKVDPADYEIYEVPSRGLSPPEPRFQITYNDTDDGTPSYSPNGAHIVYMSSDGRDLEIYRINRSYGYVRQFTNNSTEDTNPSWGIVGKAEVPYVMGLSSSAAAQKIRNAGLVPKFTGDPPGANARVVDQKPRSGTVVDRGSTVTCRLSTRIPN